MYLDYIVNPISATLTLVGFALTLALLILFLIKRSWVMTVVAPHALQLLALVSLTGVAGSLLYSNFLGYIPCHLCWWQRIFLYAQPVLFITAMWNKARIAVPALVLSILGAGVSIYHFLLQYGVTPEVGCAAVGPSCAEKVIFGYGFVTFPLMALSGFALLIILSLIQISYERQS